MKKTFLILVAMVALGLFSSLCSDFSYMEVEGAMNNEEAISSEKIELESETSAVQKVDAQVNIGFSSKTKEVEKQENLPKTGESFLVLVIMLGLVISVLAVLLIYKKEKKQEESY